MANDPKDELAQDDVPLMDDDSEKKTLRDEEPRGVMDTAGDTRRL